MGFGVSVLRLTSTSDGRNGRRRMDLELPGFGCASAAFDGRRQGRISTAGAAASVGRRETIGKAAVAGEKKERKGRKWPRLALKPLYT